MYPLKREAMLTTLFFIGPSANEYREGSAIDQSARSLHHVLPDVYKQHGRHLGRGKGKNSLKKSPGN
jgi:hypothetical protein